jgi:hypothetical protein
LRRPGACGAIATVDRLPDHENEGSALASQKFFIPSS